ncbi:MAG: 1,4-dihydroxy-2-naphthoate octaprenyltransferase [Muribaculaceae bacterium]|nr:1,4-dihydroxy-2-naphthoate octaprenyltransferase [Muribaculaceae bacterium]
MIRYWVEAMRLRTLPVSVAGVLSGTACAIFNGGFNALPFFICMLFAIISQVISNFANEYFDFKNGLDRKGRAGFRRGVTEGDISPQGMKRAIMILLIIDGLIGCSLIYWGGWLMLPFGIAIALFAFGYSTGPWPLSHHGLGEVAVIIFFGIVPVCLTDYVQTGHIENLLTLSLPVGFAIGLMGSNVLIVNNYRDVEDDRAVGKHTTVVIFGRKTMSSVYFFNGVVACLLLIWVTIGRFNILWQAGTLLYLNFHYLLWRRMQASEGSELNPLLGKTAMLMFAASLWLLVVVTIG